jgi:hypothetical protein
MTDTNPPESAREEIERLAEPAEKEAEILCKNEKREEALKESAKEETPKEEKKEEPLPKLSAADFQVYNSMADHMEYFVSILPIPTQPTSPPAYELSKRSPLPKSRIY